MTNNNQSTVTVTFEGPAGSGKTRTANILRTALVNAGGVPMRGNEECEIKLGSINIRIVENQV